MDEQNGVNKLNNSKNNHNSRSNTLIILLVLAIIIIIVLVYILLLKDKDKNIDKDYEKITVDSKNYKYKIRSNSLDNFDLYFLQRENQKINKIYSPLSIKYALEMLSEGTEGDSKEQISNIIGDYEAKNYVNNDNMSFANTLFVKDLYINSVKSKYIDTLSRKYSADVVFDAFKNTTNINSWVSNKTLNLIDRAINDLKNDTRFILVNALGIDMEWKENFLYRFSNAVISMSVKYNHEKFYWSGPSNVSSNKFNGTQEVSGMNIIASLNNYDIVSKIGEDKIRETVGNEFKKYLQDPDNESMAKEYLKGDNSEDNINKVVNQYLDNYIKQIDSNYRRVDQTTDFSLYVDDDVKAFSKDLKDYNGTTLQYIGIMPNKVELDEFITNTDAKKVSKIINDLKELKVENFKDGVVTKITGFIPKFKFDYELNLQDDLKKLGIIDVFDSNKANLAGITNEKNIFIEATHKANIEFTQDGIKAAAVTNMGGRGAGGGFDYLYDVPVEEIDLTFDKPYMFLIRDKSTGEVWFAGTVYEPLSWEKEPENKSTN